MARLIGDLYPQCSSLTWKTWKQYEAILSNMDIFAALHREKKRDTSPLPAFNFKLG